jgi:transposase
VHDIMRTQNDDDCDYLKSREARNMRKDIKAELKAAREKIKHQIKYCPVPNNIIEEAMYRYRPMNARELARMKAGNRYENAPHIGRIIPSKRP